MGEKGFVEAGRWMTENTGKGWNMIKEHFIHTHIFKILQRQKQKNQNTLTALKKKISKILSLWCPSPSHQLAPGPEETPPPSQWFHLLI